MQIRIRFTHLLELGPAYGYFAEPAKSILVVKERHLEKAKSLFADLQVQVVLSSHFLGGCAGIRQFVSSKIDTWVSSDLPKLQEPTRSLPVLP